MENANFLPAEKGKSLWNDKERALGVITGLAMFGGLGYALFKLLPYIITILENTIYTAFLLGAIVGVSYVIWKNRKMLWVLYQVAVQKTWWLIANAHPIQIMKINLREWREKRDELDEKIVNLRSSHDILKRTIEGNSDNANETFTFAKEAQKQNKNVLAQSKAMRAQNLLDSNEKLVPRYKAIAKALEFLEKLYERWGIEIESLDEDIKLKERDLQLLKQTSSALRSASSLIEGNPDDLALLAMANEAYAQQLSNNVAYITNFMKKGQKWMESSDIQDAVLKGKGDRLLEMYDENSFAELTNFKEKVLIPSSDIGLSDTANEAVKNFGELK
jgi:hypothetical protein